MSEILLGSHVGMSGKEMFFDSEIPEDMSLLIEKWRSYMQNREIG